MFDKYIMVPTTNTNYHDGCKGDMIQDKSALSQSLFKQQNMHPYLQNVT